MSMIALPLPPVSLASSLYRDDFVHHGVSIGLVQPQTPDALTLFTSCTARVIRQIRNSCRRWKCEIKHILFHCVVLRKNTIIALTLKVTLLFRCVFTHFSVKISQIISLRKDNCFTIWRPSRDCPTGETKNLSSARCVLYVARVVQRQFWTNVMLLQQNTFVPSPASLAGPHNVQQSTMQRVQYSSAVQLSAILREQ